MFTKERASCEAWATRPNSLCEPHHIDLSGALPTLSRIGNLFNTALHALTCGPDIVQGGAGFDVPVAPGASLGGQLATASNGVSGEFSVTWTENTSYGLTGIDAYVSVGAIWNAPSNASLSNPWWEGNPESSFTGGAGRVGASVSGWNSQQLTLGPGFPPVTAAYTKSSTQVLFTISYVGYALNPGRALCTLAGK